MDRPPRARPGEVNHAFVDRFTLAHAALGAVYGWLGLHVLVVLALALAWELAENPLKARVPRLFPHATADTWSNALGDVLAVVCAWWLVGALRGD